MKQKNITEIFERFERENPNPKIELNYTNPFELIVAVVLSAQSTDKGVNRATPALFKVANTPQKMVYLGEEGLKKYIKSIGLYNNKAKNIIKLSQILVDKYNSEIPNNRDELESLPGVGRKSANVILNAIFHQPYIGVDTHVFRVSNRTGMAPGKNPAEVEKNLEKVVPEKFKLKAHYWLVLHGRYICTAKKPKCDACLISDLCDFYSTLSLL